MLKKKLRLIRTKANPVRIGGTQGAHRWIVFREGREFEVEVDYASLRIIKAPITLGLWKGKSFADLFDYCLKQAWGCRWYGKV